LQVATVAATVAAIAVAVATCSCCQPFIRLSQSTRFPHKFQWVREVK